MIDSFIKINTAITGGGHSLSEIVRALLDDISAKEDLNAFVEVFSDTAMAQAEEIDKRASQGRAGRLAGMIVAIKDNICYEGHQVSASSKILEGFTSLFSATVVQRLIEQDALIIGRTACDEFAMGSSTETSVYGAVKNPKDKTRVPGGSSGGSSAAVAAGLCHVALGSDTGGSVRQPASFTGTIGFKPTYGRVSRHGLISYASSFDQIGPISNDLRDLALVMEVISGRDEYDSTLASNEVDQYASFSKPIEKKRFLYFKSYLNHKGLDAEVRNNFFSFTKWLTEQGHEVIEKDFSYVDELVPSYYVLTTAEASSNLARYDGIRYGYRSKGTHNLKETYTKSRSEGFGLEVKRRIMLGTYVLSAGYYDAYYTKAQKIRRLARDQTMEQFKAADFIIGPTSPHTAFELGSQTNDPIKMYLEDIFTVQANICGLPAISLPLSKHVNGMPYGMQVMAPPYMEDSLLSISNWLMNNKSLEDL
ncbi:MAG: Asp-tRNA(Asn)/Glu-tRNA(Gln) amidotransferase subunit GatA [Vicingaceae bacterium]